MSGIKTEELDPPKNFGGSPPFSSLVKNLFRPLTDEFRANCVARRKNPVELRNDIISKFINDWKETIGPDIYPALRLVLPDHDKERPMYGLKEKALAKLFIRVLNIGKDSGDANALMDWKSGRMPSAGVFSDKCYEVLIKRSTHTNYSSLTIDEVNAMLDDLAKESESNTFKEKEAVINKFASVLSPEEMRWLIRIILKYLRIGATERSIFNNFHPDALDLFNVTSDLKHVCWTLYDTNYRLPSEQHQIALMRCFQPQLAAFNKHSAKKIVAVMPPSGFFIEEKMDGERIQIHMDNGRFKFWSRKAKDYTYLYGDSYDAFNGKGFTANLKEVLRPEVRNIILDGEMVGWDTEEQAVVPFGHLKTAAINTKEGGNGTTRAMFLVFDVLYLNDTILVDYSLANRKKALERAVQKQIPGCFAILPYMHGTEPEDIENMFRKVIEEASEGLVIKNPESPYRINERISSWVKLKPDYLEELGEKVDVCVIGGYYGSGRRAGRLSSFLCGLRMGSDKFLSFCKVGGGITATDYAEIRHLTEGKWREVTKKANGRSEIPCDRIDTFSGPDMPDCWIDPSESIVLEVKAAEIIPSRSFKVGFTLRFPRFERIRKDRDWQSSLSVNEFMDLRKEVKQLQTQRELDLESARTKKQITSGKRRKLRLRGDDNVDLDNLRVTSALFGGKKFYIAADIIKPKRMTKGDLEILVKSYGGTITQYSKGENTIIIADRERLPAVRALRKTQIADVVKPEWLFQCIETKTILTFEPGDYLLAREESVAAAAKNVDRFGDSYTRDITSSAQLLEILQSPVLANAESLPLGELKALKYAINDQIADSPVKGLLLANSVLWFEQDIPNSDYLAVLAELLGAQLSDSINSSITHVIIRKSPSKSLRVKLPRARFVRPDWIEDCWTQSVRISEEKFIP